MTFTEVLRLKEAVRERDGQRCTECGMTAAENLRRHRSTLEVHRIRSDGPYTMEGAVALCFDCHRRRPKIWPHRQAERIAGTLRRAIKACDLSPRELASRADVDESDLAAFVANVQDLSFQDAARLVVVLGLQVVDAHGKSL